MHNNLKFIIKIFITIYLSCAALFPSVQLEKMPTFFLVAVGIMILEFKKLEIPLEFWRRSTSESLFLNDHKTFKNYFNFMKVFSSNNKI